MIPARQPQEGGITCSGCHKEVRSGYFLCDDCYTTHTSPQTPDEKAAWIEGSDAGWKCGYAAGAKAAREQVLKELRNLQYHERCPKGYDMDPDCYYSDCVLCRIESLRAQQEQP